LDALTEKVEAAKNANAELGCLISDNMPFIRKVINDIGSLGMEYDDRLSLAMLAFMNCVKQYDSGRGSFLAFAAACIRNRLIDESRKQLRYTGKVVSISPGEENFVFEAIDSKLAIEAYDQKKEQENLSYEIEVYSKQIMEFGIAFKDLPQICPKQDRSRKQCIELGRYVVSNEEMRGNLFSHRRLAQAELAKRFGLSEKTVEKHRRYIVAIVVLLTGEYPFIRSYLPQYRGI
jgi:RNA polymerase sigma factor